MTLAKEDSQRVNMFLPSPSKTQQYDCKWYIPLTDLSFQTVDESEAAPSIPLVLDEELDAMKIKISQIKSDIQREKVGREAAGPMLVWAAAHRPLGKLSWASDPLLVSGACWASPVRLGAIWDVGWERSPPTIIGRSSQVGGQPLQLSWTAPVTALVVSGEV